MFRSKLKFIAAAAVITVGSVAFLASCKKNKDATTTSEDIGYAADHAVAEKSFNDAESISDQASTVTTGGSINYRTTGITSACATVTRTTGHIVIDFGATDCLCNDGRTRRGKILVDYTGNYSDSGSIRTISFDNYYQSDNKIMGTKTVQNMGHNSLGQPYFNVTVAGSVLLSTGATISTAWNRVRTWTDGYNTPTDFSDDGYSLSGAGTLTRASGAVVGIAISSSAPLILKAGCQYIEAGKLTFTMATGVTRSINYGDTPVCDNAAVLTLPSGATYNVTLP